MPSAVNTPASGVPFFTPAQVPAAGTGVQKDDKPLPTLFQPLTIRGTTFHNRIFLAPLCQYSAKDGHIQPWHFAHLGGIFTRGPGLSIVEATAIVPEGRITPEDVGIWSDEHVKSFVPLVQFAHSQNQKIAVQIAHAGRKASTIAPWLDGTATAGEDVGGWPKDTVGPSAVSFAEDYPLPIELTVEGIKGVVQAFKDAAIRAVKAGFDVIEIHGAHGYLLSSFNSSTSNKRIDDYGGSFENRIRLSLEVIDAVRSVIPDDMPLFYRISGSENLETSLPNEPSWRSEDTARFAPLALSHGVDLLDVSSGGNHPAQKANVGPGYQAPLAEAAKKAAPKLIVSAVGIITDGHVAQGILDKGQADVILVGRGFQKNPGLVWAFAEQLGVEASLANQIHWGFRGRRRQAKPAAEKL